MLGWAFLVIPLILLGLGALSVYFYNHTSDLEDSQPASKVEWIDKAHGTWVAEFKIDADMPGKIENAIQQQLLNGAVPIQTLALNSEGGESDAAQHVIEVLSRYPDIQVVALPNEVSSKPDAPKKDCNSACVAILGDAVKRGKATIPDTACMLFHTGMTTEHYGDDKGTYCAVHTGGGANIMLPWVNNLTHNKFSEYLRHCDVNPLATISGITFDGLQIKQIQDDDPNAKCKTHFTPPECHQPKYDCNVP